MSNVNALAEPHRSATQAASAECLSVQDAHGKTHVFSEALQQVINQNNTTDNVMSCYICCVSTETKLMHTDCNYTPWGQVKTLK